MSLFNRQRFLALAWSISLLGVSCAPSPDNVKAPSQTQVTAKPVPEVPSVNPVQDKVEANLRAALKITLKPEQEANVRSQDNLTQVDVPQKSFESSLDLSADSFIGDAEKKDNTIESSIRLQPKGSVSKQPIRIMFPLKESYSQGQIIRVLRYNEHLGEYYGSVSDEGKMNVASVNQDGQSATTFIDRLDQYGFFAEADLSDFQTKATSSQPLGGYFGIRKEDISVPAIEIKYFPYNGNDPKNLNNRVILYTPVIGANATQYELIAGNSIIVKFALNDNYYRKAMYKELLKELIFDLVQSETTTKNTSAIAQPGQSLIHATETIIGLQKFNSQAIESGKDIVGVSKKIQSITNEALQAVLKNHYAKLIISDKVGVASQSLKQSLAKFSLAMEGLNLAGKLQYTIPSDILKIALPILIDRALTEAYLVEIIDEVKKDVSSNRGYDEVVLVVLEEMLAEIKNENLRQIPALLADLVKQALTGESAQVSAKTAIKLGGTYLMSKAVPAAMSAMHVSSGSVTAIVGFLASYAYTTALDDFILLGESYELGQKLTLAATIDRSFLKDVSFTDDTYLALLKAKLAHFFYASQDAYLKLPENEKFWFYAFYDTSGFEREMDYAPYRGIFRARESIAASHLRQLEERLFKTPVATPANIPGIPLESPTPLPQENPVETPPSTPEPVDSTEAGLLPPSREPITKGDYTNSLGMTFVSIPVGSFMMGSPDGEAYPYGHPQHSVTLSAFQMMSTEVTQGQWEAVMGSGNWPGTAPSSTFGVGDNYPMYYVSWCDIAGASGDPINCSSVPVGESFLDKLNTAGTGTYRLPTEAEWEYAARAGTTTTYACGEYLAGANGCPDSMAWFNENNGSSGNPDYGTKPVGTKQANAWGLYDMHGNLWEWVNDWYGSNYYSSSPSTNPTGSATGFYRVMRGGSWISAASNARSAYRGYMKPADPSHSFGFRLVRLPGS
jgi:formylglycine-generating enzyme required for sulfatase activity